MRKAIGLQLLYSEQNGAVRGSSPHQQAITSHKISSNLQPIIISTGSPPFTVMP